MASRNARGAQARREDLLGQDGQLAELKDTPDSTATSSTIMTCTYIKVIKRYKISQYAVLNSIQV